MLFIALAEALLRTYRRARRLSLILDNCPALAAKHPKVRLLPGSHATASIKNAHNVYVGKNSHINQLCCVWAGEKAKVILGDNVLMGSGVSIFAVQSWHAQGTADDVPGEN